MQGQRILRPPFPIIGSANNLVCISGQRVRCAAQRQVILESIIGVSPMLNRPTLYALVALAVVSRMLPHPPNFVFLGALGLFAGCHLRGVAAVMVPLLALLVSDVIGSYAGLLSTGIYPPIVIASVYTGMAASALIGMQLRRRRTALRIATAALACSTCFFVLSNFGVWAAGFYPASLAGLAACYAAALPFFQFTVASDLLYTAITFGTLALWQGPLRQGLPRPMLRRAAAHVGL